MKHVDQKRLRLLRFLFIAYTAHFLVGFAVLWQKNGNFEGNNAFTPSLAGLALLALIYELVASIFAKKKSLWVKTLTSFSFALVATFVVLETTGVYTSPYILAVLVLIFLSSALSQYIAFGVVLMLLVGFLLALSGLFKNNEGGTLGGLITLAASSISALFGYFYWRRHYEATQDPETEHLKTALDSRQQQSDILLKSVADGVVVTDTKGRITLINPAAADLTGWPVEEATNLAVSSVIKLSEEDGKPLPAGTNPFEEVFKSKQAVKKTLQLFHKDNKQKKIVSLVVSPVVVPPQYELVGAVAVMRDISRQRQEEMQRAEFISTASHEMRTPVAAIEGYLALAMNDRVSKIDSKAREYLEKAHSSTQHLGKLFQDLLTSAKAEDGRLSNHPAVVEMGSFLDQVTSDLKFAAQKKGIQTKIVVGSGQDGPTSDVNSKVLQPLYFVHVDPERLREVITNLFDNAIKYTESGTITIGLTGNAELVQFFIRDTGAGIPAEDIPHLFQKFYRVNNTLTRAEGGTGLGLFISRIIIEISNGRIWVESELGKGSTFYINLPRLSAAKAAELQAQESTQIVSEIPAPPKAQP